MDPEQLIDPYLQIVTEGRIPRSYNTRRQALNRLIQLVNQELRLNGEGFDNGDYGQRTWEDLHLNILLAGMILSGTFAREDGEIITPADIEEEYEEQEEYFAGFSAAVRAGEVAKTEGRSGQYATSLLISYAGYGSRLWTGRGFELWTSELGRCEHCSECESEANRPPRSLRNVVPLGQRICRNNCCCRLRSVRVTGRERVLLIL